MPHLRFRAVEFDHVKALSTKLVDDLQPLMACPREDFTLEHISTTFIFDGEVSDATRLWRCCGLIVARMFRIRLLS